MNQDRIRVAYVIDTIDEPTGGTETQLIALLERLDRSRFDPHLFCLRSSDWLAEEAVDLEWTNLDIHVSPRLSLLFGLHAFAKVLRGGRFDVVQTHFKDGNVFGVLAAWRARTPSIISTRRGEPYWRSRAELLAQQQLDRIPTAFIANSEATKKKFARWERIPGERIEVVYNGVDASRFVAIDAESRCRLRREFDLPLEARVVGLVGNLRPVKGIDVFVRAAATVLRTHPGTHFVVVGQGPEEATLRRLVADMHLEGFVHLVGVRRDVPRLLQIFDVGVLASHFESFSNSILEYLMAGIPVVVTDVGGAREVVKEGDAGFIVPPGNAEEMAQRISELLARCGEADDIPRKSRLDDRFTMQRMVKGHERVYEDQMAWAARVGRRGIH